MGDYVYCGDFSVDYFGVGFCFDFVYVLGNFMNCIVFDFWVGFFVVIGIVVVMFLVFKVGNFLLVCLFEMYVLYVKFDNIGGFKVCGLVKSVGVVIGWIVDISFDLFFYEVVVMMMIDGCYWFFKDIFVLINMVGFLGE